MDDRRLLIAQGAVYREWPVIMLTSASNLYLLPVNSEPPEKQLADPVGENRRDVPVLFCGFGVLARSGTRGSQKSVNVAGLRDPKACDLSNIVDRERSQQRYKRRVRLA